MTIQIRDKSTPQGNVLTAGRFGQLSEKKNTNYNLNTEHLISGNILLLVHSVTQ